jgi:hypothetical protein
MTLLNDLIKDTNFAKEQYNALVVAYIRERYSQDDENAILRKKLANTDTENEFEAYNKYVEECKARAKKELNM